MRLPLSFVFNSGLILIIYRNDIKNRLKNNEDFVINKNKLKVYSLNNLEEYKGLLSEKFDIESWGKYKEFSKFKLNKKGLEDLIIKINLLENKEYVIFESEDNNIYLYY